MSRYAKPIYRTSGADLVRIATAPSRSVLHSFARGVRQKRHFMVLPVRIELTTSPLPRGCSTTELRQHGQARTCSFGAAILLTILGIGPVGAQRFPDLATSYIGALHERPIPRQ